MLAIEVGQRFGALTVQGFQGKGSGIPRRAQCLCDCGAIYDVNVSRLFYGVTVMCRKCLKISKRAPREITIGDAFRRYKHSARYRGHVFSLTIEDVERIYFSDCTYCGLSPAKGIDRRESTIGYIFENCVPCCKRCNYAKGTETEKDFLEWIARIAAKQGFSL